MAQHVCLFMHDLREPHYTSMNRILRYVRRTFDQDLQLYVTLSRGLVAYSDAKWVGCPSNR